MVDCSYRRKLIPSKFYPTKYCDHKNLYVYGTIKDMERMCNMVILESHLAYIGVCAFQHGLCVHRVSLGLVVELIGQWSCFWPMKLRKPKYGQWWQIAVTMYLLPTVKNLPVRMIPVLLMNQAVKLLQPTLRSAVLYLYNKLNPTFSWYWLFWISHITMHYINEFFIMYL